MAWQSQMVSKLWANSSKKENIDTKWKQDCFINTIEAFLGWKKEKEHQDGKWLEGTWGPNTSRQGWSREKHLDMLFWH